MRSPLITLPAAGLLATSLLAAQSGQTVFVDAVDVELVLVDLWAEDRRGQPVSDLSREEIRLFEDGRPVEISQFTGPSGPGSSARPRDSRAEPGERFVVFFDNLHLGSGSRLRAFRPIANLVHDRLRPQDEVMVVSFTGRVEVLLPFSSNRRDLRRVLEEEARRGAILLDSQLAEARILELIQNRMEETTQKGDSRKDPCTDIGYLARAHAEQTYGRVTQTIRELETLVNSLAPYPGRKSLLHVSDGIPVVTGLEAYRYAIEMCDGTGVQKGLRFARDTLINGANFNRWDSTKAWSELTQFDTSRDWTRLAQHANTYQVSFYTLQASGPMSSRRASVDAAETSAETQAEGYRGKQDSLFVLADETGGLAILDKTDFVPDLERMVQDSRRGYQLAYEPPTPGDGKSHRIKVEVTRPGVEIRHRRSYRSKTAHERMADGMLASLLHGREDNTLGLRLEVASRKPAGKHRNLVRLRLRVPIERLVLLSEEDWRRGLFTVFVGARNERGETTRIGQKTVPLQVPAAGGESDFVYEVELPLRAVDHQVAVGLRDEIGGNVSYVTKTVRASTL